ncbi:WxL domain-containing protein [Carnobacterium divergens]|uniref:WxL domain-containing protein n=1 Tax=Carnobacterium divergens TaxID=2748 RepID=A0A7Z8D0W3_CARDV|nr:WxL domain-containing protein [Carnobacterium divergens]MPQ22533.1 WxL domain-containing protein [Carnobacterium divergens]TFI73552.1 hypothetical protein CKN58_06140 [Carnobacterium divergens]TFI77499.1 hypothetical protein CKN85_06135 [Carnobacterium divergens]TFI84262.1 hypothetical protein CKN56_06175 [Carnobacterium divergens]TFI96109.1 hypothetical protein CKN64_06115 [Carnobacterium divergens]
MNKKTLTIGFISAVTLLSTSSVFAAEVQEGMTDLQAEFLAGTVTPPEATDPSDTSNPGTGNDAASLALMRIPKLFHFKSTAVATGTAAIPLGDTSPTYYTEVEDVRGTHAGWNLTAKISNKLTSGSQGELPGASISMPGVSMNSVRGTVSNPTVTPTPNEAILLSNDSTPDLIVDAKDGQGAGAWQALIPADQLQLKVADLAKVKVGDDYAGKITWTLTAGPNQTPY